MPRTRKLTVEIAGDVNGVRRAFSQVDNDANKFGRRMTRVAGVLGGAFAVGEVVEFGGALVDAAEESQKASRQTEAVLKSMGRQAGVTEEQVADLADTLSMKAGIDDELIQSGQNVLLTFGKVRNEVGKGNQIFDRATAVALDMSVALKKDLAGSAMTVGKALNDPVRGLTALRRAGIQFTAQQEDQTKAMVAVGDVLGAQKIMVEELERQFGGSAAAQATSTDKLRVAWDNLKEELGTRSLPVVEKVATWLADELPGAVDKTMAGLDKISKWCKDNTTPLKALGVVVGVTLVGAFLAWTASAVAAAAATIAATWPVLVIIGAVAALAAGLLYLKAKWDDTGSSVWKVRYALKEIGDVMAPIAAAGYMVASGILAIVGAVADLIGKLNIVKPLLSVLGRVAEMFGGGLGGKAGALIDQMAGAQSAKQAGKNANGTNNWRGGLTWLGERGPELVNLPRGSEVFSHSRSMAMAGGGRPQVIQLVVDRRVLAEVLADEHTVQARNRAS